MRIREATPMEKEGRLGVPSTSTPMLLSNFIKRGACTISRGRWRRRTRSWQDEGVTKLNCDRAPTRWDSTDEIGRSWCAGPGRIVYHL